MLKIKNRGNKIRHGRNSIKKKVRVEFLSPRPSIKPPATGWENTERIINSEILNIFFFHWSDLHSTYDDVKDYSII